jgi:hypothetical protein
MSGQSGSLKLRLEGSNNVGIRVWLVGKRREAGLALLKLVQVEAWNGTGVESGRILPASSMKLLRRGDREQVLKESFRDFAK